MTGFYDVTALGELAVNLFHGYGYNFYRDENQLRADDQKVRTLVCALLARAQRSVAAAEAAFRRERIPPPTRATPFPPADVLADARRLEALGRAIGAVEGQVRHAPVPENDRMTQRYREEATALNELIEKDKRLVGQSEMLRSIVADQTPEQLLTMLPQVEEGLAALRRSLDERRLVTI